MGMPPALFLRTLLPFREDAAREPGRARSEGDGPVTWRRRAGSCAPGRGGGQTLPAANDPVRGAPKQPRRRRRCPLRASPTSTTQLRNRHGGLAIKPSWPWPRRRSNQLALAVSPLPEIRTATMRLSEQGGTDWPPVSAPPLAIRERLCTSHRNGALLLSHAHPQARSLPPKSEPRPPRALFCPDRRCRGSRKPRCCRRRRRQTPPPARNAKLAYRSSTGMPRSKNDTGCILQGNRRDTISPILPIFIPFLWDGD